MGGAGNGGLNDIQELLEHLAAIVLIVLHRSVEEVSDLRELLDCR